MIILKTGLWYFFCKGTFIIGESDLFFGMGSSVCQAATGSLCWFPGKFYLPFLPLGSTTPENARILSGTLNVFSKSKTKSAGEKEVF